MLIKIKYCYDNFKQKLIQYLYTHNSAYYLNIDKLKFISLRKFFIETTYRIFNLIKGFDVFLSLTRVQRQYKLR